MITFGKHVLEHEKELWGGDLVVQPTIYCNWTIVKLEKKWEPKTWNAMSNFIWIIIQKKSWPYCNEWSSTWNNQPRACSNGHKKHKYVFANKYKVYVHRDHSEKMICLHKHTSIFNWKMFFIHWKDIFLFH